MILYKHKITVLVAFIHLRIFFYINIKEPILVNKFLSSDVQTFYRTYKAD
jgi:hypothetical protein